MGRKILITSLVALMLLHASVVEANESTTTTNTPFHDVAGHPAEKDIFELLVNGVLKDNGTGQFRPDEPVTRAELLTIFLAASGIEPTPITRSSFADVPIDNWLAPYAETAYRLGVVNGKWLGGKLYLGPNEEVERVELVAMLLRTRGDSGRINQMPWSTAIKTLNAYPDKEQVATWGQRSYAYALIHKIMTPLEGNTLQPDKITTRGEAARYTYQHLLQKTLTENKWKQMISPLSFFSYKRVMTVQTTAFDFTSGSKGYLGFGLRVGTVAVDPNVIPLGTHLYIEGYGYAVAADIGSAVKKNHIDVFLPSNKAALAYGRQKDTKVYILN